MVCREFLCVPSTVVVIPFCEGYTHTMIPITTSFPALTVIPLFRHFTYLPYLAVQYPVLYLHWIGFIAFVRLRSMTSPRDWQLAGDTPDYLDCSLIDDYATNYR